MENPVLCESLPLHNQYEELSQIINILKKDLYYEISEIINQEDFIEKYKYYKNDKLKISTAFYQYMLKDPNFVKTFIDQIPWKNFIINNINDVNATGFDLKMNLHIMFFDYIYQKQREFNIIIMLTYYVFYHNIKNLISIIIPKISYYLGELLVSDNFNRIEPNRLTIFEYLQQILRYLF